MTPTAAFSQTCAGGNIIDDRMGLAMEVVRVNNLPAPKAARLYALTAMTLETALDETPRHPEYVSAHSAFSSAVAHVLTAQIGAQKFCIGSEGLKDAERCYDSFFAAANEAGQSRIYGGIHYPFSNEDGLKLGRDVARFVLTGNP